ncbi:MAG TPA: hypothetical protein EYG68_12930 [Leucothrix mucor]|nr:hypothetical protein [Leucothrix mucor]
MKEFGGMLFKGIKYVNKKALSLAVCLAVSYSSATYALGLGEIESSSHLNQPFRAKINLLSTSAADVQRLQVRIASPEVFRRVGIERPKYLNNITFTPSVANGKPVILVSSSQPVTQPFLNFLLEVSWPNGQLLKEYTVLLDPPVLVQPGTAVANNTVGVRAEPKRQQQAQTLAARAPAAATRPPKQVSKKTVAPRKASAPARKTARSSGNRTNKYRVVRGDSLYKVAKKLARRGVRTEQMMMALYRANPTAFRKRNVNNLKAGALLRRPSKKEALRTSYAKARSSIYKQSREWRKYRSKLAKKTIPQSQVQPSASKGSARTQVAKNTQARIEVIGSSSSAVDTKNLSAAGSAKVDKLERQLVQANESLAAKANANTELKSRVSELESLLRKKNRLITLKNEQLAELQAKLGVPVSATATDAEGSDISQQLKNAVNQDGNIVRSGEAIEAEVAKQADPITNEPLAVIDGSAEIPSVFEDTPVAQPEGVEQQGTTTEEPLVSGGVDTESTGDNQGGVLDLLSSPLVMGIGGGSLLALLFGWLLMRRRGKSGDYEEYSSIDFDDPDFAPGSTANAKSGKLDPDDAFAGLEGDFDDLDFGDTVESDISSKDDGNSRLNDASDDILQEADVYIVYGLHDQAEVELKKALEKQPNNLHYHAKLLENYKVSSDLDAFNQQAETFSKLPDDSDANKDKLWKTITEWAQELKSDSKLFATSSSSATGVVAGATAAVVAGGVAITAGKAFAEDKLDNVKDIFDGDSKVSSAATAPIEDINLDDLDLGTDKNDLDFDVSDLQLSDKDSFDDDLDLDALLGDDESFKLAESASDELDASSLNDLLDDDFDAPDLSMSDATVVDDNAAEIGSEFEDLLDLDLTDLGGDLSLDADSKDSDSVDLGLSNLNLELDNDDDLNKILPSSSAYISTKDDASGTDNLLGDLDDDLSFMGLDDGDHDLKETQVSTKLDLARAYLDMGDIEGARNTLEEVMMEGNDDQKKEAEELLRQAG